MRKPLAILALFSVILAISCGGPIGTVKSAKDEYTISYFRGWKPVTEFKQPNTDNLEVVFVREDLPSFIGVKVASQTRLDIQQGHIREVTAEYAKDAEKKVPGYTLVSHEYKNVPNALGDERLELVFSAIEGGQSYTIIQHIYAIIGKVLYVTGTYPEGDEALANQIKDTMESFVVAPKK